MHLSVATRTPPGTWARCGECREGLLIHPGALTFAGGGHSDVRRDLEDRPPD